MARKLKVILTDALLQELHLWYRNDVWARTRGKIALTESVKHAALHFGLTVVIVDFFSSSFQFGRRCRCHMTLQVCAYVYYSMETIDFVSLWIGMFGNRKSSWLQLNTKHSAICFGPTVLVLSIYQNAFLSFDFWVCGIGYWVHFDRIHE